MTASPNLCPAAAKISRFRLVGLFIPILALLLMVGSATPVRADGITIAPLHQAQTVPEESQLYQVFLDYTINNNNPFPVILDYALFTVFKGPEDYEDHGDWPYFVQWDPVIAANSSSNWVVSVDIEPGPPCTPIDCDNGVDPITFSTEWSQLIGNYAVFPLPPGFNGYIVVIDNNNNLVPSANYGNGVNDLMNGVVPSSPIDVGGQQSTVAGTLTVYDTPEPGTMLLLGSGLLSLAGVVRRKSSRG